MAREPPGNGVHFQWLQGVPEPGCELGGAEQAAAANSASARLLGLKCSGCCSAWGQCQAAQGLQDGTSLYERFLRLGVWERRQPPRAVLMPEEQQEGSGIVQLVGDNSLCSGRVEIHDGDQWKTVCDSDFGPKAATVVCRELQCGTALSVAGAAHFGEGDGPIWDRELRPKIVQKEERGKASIWPLLYLLREQKNKSVLSHPSLFLEFTGFRLVNGSTACEGRVEVQVLGTWGTLCASHWDLLDAHVLCRHLDCGFAKSIPRPGHFGRATHPFWRDSFHCDGTEGHLGQCPVTALGALCSHENDAAVVCSADSASLRLVGGGSRCDGRVEILQRGTWGRVLDDQWDVQEASVVCRQLGCGEAEKAYNPPKPQRGSGPVGLRGVRCAGHEANLTLCNKSLPESAPVAGTAEDVGVVCWGSRQVRLVNGPGRCAGRVEVYYQGRWGTVCDDGWDLSDATVICHQLGCGGAVQAVGSARFGEGSGQIWLDGVNCSGAEDSLWDCPAGSWGQHDCGHKEDAGVVCSEFVALRLENSNNCSGHLQVFYNGTWGSICSNSMTPKTVLLACKELGCGDEGSLETQRTYGRTSGPTWLDHVQCGERNSSFWQCPSGPWDPQSCDDLQDETHITCNGNSELPGHQATRATPQLLLLPRQGQMQRQPVGTFSLCARLCCCWLLKMGFQVSEPHTYTSSCQLGSQQHPGEAEVSPGKVSEETSHGSEDCPLHGHAPAAL
ncbi:scavenger receptor cysteine-rich domain-containing protein SCART1-like [Morphnus guianensis]